MANEKPKELDASSKESSSISKDELFSGSLESSEGNEEAGTESPPVVAKSDDTGKSASESEDSDPELKGIFDDLEKDIPETLKNHATNVKKKLQGYFTKKNQTISTELETLRKNQVTDDLKRDYSTLYGWYDKIQRNPKEGLKELASQYGVSVAELVSASEAVAPPVEEELTPDKLVTAEDYAKFARQEARKAAEEIRDKEVKPLREALSKFQGNSVQRENIQRGQAAVEEAIATLPGFADENKKISKEGNEAIASVLNEEFRGVNALKNAFHAIIANSSVSKVKELETKLNDLKKNVAGASNPPGNTSTQTTVAPGKPETFWEDLRAEPLLE